PRGRPGTPHRLLHREGGMNAPRTVLLKVFRYGPANAGPRFEEFRVPSRPPAAPGLQASCGTCGMGVNGREVLACVTRLEELGDPVVAEPLAGAPVAGDLVVDMGYVYRRVEPGGRALGAA